MRPTWQSPRWNVVTSLKSPRGAGDWISKERYQIRILSIRGVGPMIRKLRPKPAMDGSDQAQIFSRETNLRSIGEFGILNVYLFNVVRKLADPRHISTMKRGRIGEIAGTEAQGLMLKVLSDQRDLICVARVVGNYLLDTAAFSHFKNMSRIH